MDKMHHLAFWRERMDVLKDGGLLLNWERDIEAGDGDSYRHIGGLLVVVSFSVESDGEVWQHLSASYRGRVPNHREMSDLKDLFIGRDLYAYAVWPPEDKYVNIHPNCLHLWHRCTPDYGRVLPEFSRTVPGTDIRSI